MEFPTPGNIYIKHNFCTQGLEREKRWYETKVCNEIRCFSYGREDRPRNLKNIAIERVGERKNGGREEERKEGMEGRREEGRENEFFSQFLIIWY